MKEKMILNIKENEGAVNAVDPNSRIDIVCYKLGNEEIKTLDISSVDVTSLMTFVGLLKNTEVLKISYNAKHVKSALEPWFGGEKAKNENEWYSIKAKAEKLKLPTSLYDLCYCLEIDFTNKTTEPAEILKKELEVYNIIKDCETKEDIKNIKGIGLKKVKAKPLSKYFVKNKQNLIVRVNDSLIEEDILKNNDLFICTNTPYIYKDNAYVTDINGSILRGIIREYLDVTVKNQTTIKRIYNYIVDTPSLQKEFEQINQYPESWVCFKNCMWDVENWKAYPSSPKYYAINQIPHNFTGEIMYSDNTVTEEFFTDFIPKEDDREMLKQYIGYCLTRDTRQQKMLVLKGMEGVGKSVILRRMTEIVGENNMKNNSLEKLKDKFTTVELAGMLVNTCGDISSKGLDDISLIKQLIGEDRIKAEIKHGQHVYFTPYVKHLFSANQIPVSLDEKSGSFYRRLLVLKLNRKAKYIHNLEKKLKQETDYMIHECLMALQRMYKSDGK